jgi:hypothetical protein
MFHDGLPLRTLLTEKEPPLLNVVKFFGVPALMLAGACSTNSGSLAPSPQSHVAAPRAVSHDRRWGPNVSAACPDRRPDEAQCFLLIRTGPQLVPDGGSGPNGGFTPAQLQKAYNLPSATRGSGQIIAIVDAYDNPRLADDLAYYRSYFGMPAANFTKYNQLGQLGAYPVGNEQWGAEEDLDVQMASASCQNCSIVLIEANSPSAKDLGNAVKAAAALGAHIISNSYGCYTACGLKEKYFEARGVTYLAASGDDGYGTGVGTPGAFAAVVDVGGTTLVAGVKGKRGFEESAWPGTNSGCSHKSKPSWQHDPGCAFRTANDIAAIADPNTGPAFYDTYGFSGWLVGGGTSASTPLIAGAFGLAGNASSQNGGRTFWEKAHEGPNDLYRITRGKNGTCKPAYLCQEGTQEYRDYGGPAGWGTPNGIGAF